MEISEAEAKNALAAVLKRRSRWNRFSVDEIRILDMVPSWAFTYFLASFIERRWIEVVSGPHKPGTDIDGPKNGSPPALWEMIVEPPSLFKAATKRIAVPHTEVVEMCSRCCGKGTLACGRCKGEGKGEESSNCTADKCNKNGRITCDACKGDGELKFFRQLCVRFEVKTSDCVDLAGCQITSNRSLRRFEELLTRSSGRITFDEEAKAVLPVQTHSNSGMNGHSTSFIEEHRLWCVKRSPVHPGQARILQQRHWIRAIPVTEVAYSKSNRTHTFWIYGEERAVFAERYPSRFSFGRCW